jgi:hypothetical protein
MTRQEFMLAYQKLSLELQDAEWSYREACKDAARDTRDDRSSQWYPTTHRIEDYREKIRNLRREYRNPNRR